MIRLNRRFVEICVGRAEQFMRGSIEAGKGDGGWGTALRYYKKNRHDYGAILPKIAIGHIRDDLAHAIHLTLQDGIALDRAEYDSLGARIEKCIDDAFAAPPLRGTSKEAFWRSIARYTGLERVGIQILRERAWTDGHNEQQRDLFERHILGLD